MNYPAACCGVSKRVQPGDQDHQTSRVPESLAASRGESDPQRFEAKRKQHNDKRELDPKWKEYRRKYAREVYAGRLKERRQNDPEWAEKQRKASRLYNAKRKADPILHAAYLAQNRECCKKYYRG